MPHWVTKLKGFHIRTLPMFRFVTRCPCSSKMKYYHLKQKSALKKGLRLVQICSKSHISSTVGFYKYSAAGASPVHHLCLLFSVVSRRISLGSHAYLQKLVIASEILILCLAILILKINGAVLTPTLGTPCPCIWKMKCCCLTQKRASALCVGMQITVKAIFTPSRLTLASLQKKKIKNMLLASPLLSRFIENN